MSVRTPTLPPTRSEEHARRHLGLTVGLAVLGIFVTYVPITGVSIALTNIGQATHASTSDLQWVSDGYVIPMAAAVLSAGLFGDRYGRRRIFLIGMALTVIGAATAVAAGLQQAPCTPASQRGRRQLDDHDGQQADLEARRPRVKHHIEPSIAKQQRSQHHQADDQHLPAAPGRPAGRREGRQLR
jgi:Major Facilitator Superfamily